MSPSLVLWLVIASLPAVPIFLAVGHWASRTGWLPSWSHAFLAWGAVSAAGHLTFWAFFAHRQLGELVATLLPMVALGYLVNAWRRARSFRLIVVPGLGHNLLTIACVALCYLGLLGLWRSDQSPDWLAANRFLPGLPLDNEIPRLFADRLQSGMSPRQLIGDWLSSDRPPLQSGFILLLRQPALALGGDNQTVSFLASVLFQLSWVPGLGGLLAAVGARRRETALVIAATTLTGACLLHSVFTWPKLGAAGLVLGGASLLLFAPVGRKAFAIGAALCALGYLGHGGVMFSLLALAPFVLARMPGVRSLAAAAVCFFAIVGPWMAYQKFYEPPGNRLLKWHLAGAIPIDDRGTLETLRASYGSKSLAEHWENKRANLLELFTDGPWKSFSFPLRNAGEQRAAEFFHFFRGLGFGFWLMLAFPLAAWRLARDVQDRTIATGGSLLLGWSLATLAVWVVLMFGPATTLIHQGSLVPLVVMWAIPVLGLIRAFPLLFWPFLALQFSALIAVWGPPSHLAAGPLATWTPVATTLGTVGLLLLAYLPPQNTSKVNPAPFA